MIERSSNESVRLVQDSIMIGLALEDIIGSGLVRTLYRACRAIKVQLDFNMPKHFAQNFANSMMFLG